MLIINHIGVFLVVDSHSGNDSDSSSSDQRLQNFFDADKINAPNPADFQQRVQRRTRANLAQRDTANFAFVRLWTTLAELLAPIFAAFAAKKASQYLLNKRSASQRSKKSKSPSKKPLNKSEIL
jgi:hypothetical protein